MTDDFKNSRLSTDFLFLQYAISVTKIWMLFKTTEIFVRMKNVFFYLTLLQQILFLAYNI